MKHRPLETFKSDTEIKLEQSIIRLVRKLKRSVCG